MYLQELRGEVSQDDIFERLPIAYATSVGRLESLDIRAILLTYDCEYDKPSTKLIMAMFAGTKYLAHSS